MGDLVKKSNITDLPVTEAAFNDFLITGQRMAIDLAMDIKEEIEHMHGRDKVNCWSRFVEVFFVTIPKGLAQPRSSQDAQRDDLMAFLSADPADTEDSE